MPATRSGLRRAGWGVRPTGRATSLSANPLGSGIGTRPDWLEAVIPNASESDRNADLECEGLACRTGHGLPRFPNDLDELAS